MEIPRRYSLATQAAASIKEGIRNGTWIDTLPGERQLCEFLQISRPTLRAAMDILHHEGLVKVQPRQKTSILRAGVAGRPAGSGSVVLLTSRPLHEHAADMVSFVGELQLALSRSGLRFIIVENPIFGKKNPRRFLEKIVSEHNAACYVLMRVSEETQMFFSALRLPAFIRGSRFPKVRLPSSDWDFHAIGRHAAGTLLAKGHTRVGLVLPSEIRTGDLHCEAGFRAAAAPHFCAVYQGTGRAASLHEKILRACGEKSRVTGLFVLNPYDCVTIFFALKSLGLRVPEDISVIGCERAEIFQVLPFRVTSYSARLKLVEKSVKLVMRLALNRFVPPHENMIMPEFEPGETLGRR